jgi:hypothetical protein
VRGLQPQMGQDSVSAAMMFLHPGHFRRAIGTSACEPDVMRAILFDGGKFVTSFAHVLE